jgi:hypothetical protein
MTLEPVTLGIRRLIRSSGHIVQDGPLWSVCWADIP